jgi:hypothetical protein
MSVLVNMKLLTLLLLSLLAGVAVGVAGPVGPAVSSNSRQQAAGSRQPANK